MKPHHHLLLILLLVLPALACRTLSINPVSVQGSGKIVTQTVDVSNFDRVTLQGSGDVYIEQGQTESLSIEADDNILPLLENKVSGSELTLSTKPNQSINPSKKIVYRITVKDLAGISLNGSGRFFVSPVKSDAMDVSLFGSGDINMEDVATGKLSMKLFGSGSIAIATVSATTVESSVSGSGDIKLAGKADSQNVSFSGSGSYQAGDLETASAVVNIPGSADVTVWTTDELNANINGSGTVSYYGKPTVNQTGNGSGKMVSLGEK